jgi:hypothetical protein
VGVPWRRKPSGGGGAEEQPWAAAWRSWSGVSSGGGRGGEGGLEGWSERLVHTAGLSG